MFFVCMCLCMCLLIISAVIVCCCVLFELHVDVWAPYAPKYNDTVVACTCNVYLNSL